MQKTSKRQCFMKRYGMTPIQKAETLNIVKSLIEAGADVKTRDE